jgi:hypothetical protein
MMGDAYRVAKQAYDKQDKTMATRDAGLTQEQVEAAKVHAAGSSHCREIKSKSAFSRYSTRCQPRAHTSTKKAALHGVSGLLCNPKIALARRTRSNMKQQALCTQPTASSLPSFSQRFAERHVLAGGARWPTRVHSLLMVVYAVLRARDTACGVTGGE